MWASPSIFRWLLIFSGWERLDDEELAIETPRRPPGYTKSAIVGRLERVKLRENLECELILYMNMILNLKGS